MSAWGFDYDGGLYEPEPLGHNGLPSSPARGATAQNSVHTIAMEGNANPIPDCQSQLIQDYPKGYNRMETHDYPKADSPGCNREWPYLHGMLHPLSHHSSPGLCSRTGHLLEQPAHHSRSRAGHKEKPAQPVRSRAERDNGDTRSSTGLACPFLKHHPRKYKEVRSCSSGRWKSIHRLK